MKYLGFLLIVICFGSRLQAQVVNVTAAFDSTNVVIGGTTTLRVFAQVNEFNRSAADQILAWHLDLIKITIAIMSSSGDTESLVRLAKRGPFPELRTRKS